MKRCRRVFEKFLFPRVCVFCGGLLIEKADPKANELCAELSVCPTCLASLPFKSFESHRMCCLSNAYDEDPIPNFSVLVPFRYEGEIVPALRALKFHDAPYIAGTLAFFMAESVLRCGTQFDAVLPVPLSDSRLRTRGYNQAGILASEIANRVGLPCLDGFLIRTRKTRQQSRYRDPGLRAANVRGSFAVPDRASVDDLSLLLVDDVFTTGNTLHEAALALFRARAGSVTAITAASGRREGDEKGFLTQMMSDRSASADK